MDSNHFWATFTDLDQAIVLHMSTGKAWRGRVVDAHRVNVGGRVVSAQHTVALQIKSGAVLHIDIAAIVAVTYDAGGE